MVLNIVKEDLEIAFFMAVERPFEGIDAGAGDLELPVQLVASVILFDPVTGKVYLMERTDTGELEFLSGKFKLSDESLVAIARREVHEEVEGDSIANIVWSAAKCLLASEGGIGKSAYTEVCISQPERGRQLVVLRFLVPVMGDQLHLKTDQLEDHCALHAVDLANENFNRYSFRSHVKECLLGLREYSAKAGSLLHLLLPNVSVQLPMLIVDRLPYARRILLKKHSAGGLMLPHPNVLSDDDALTDSIFRELAHCIAGDFVWSTVAVQHICLGVTSTIKVSGTIRKLCGNIFTLVAPHTVFEYPSAEVQITEDYAWCDVPKDEKALEVLLEKVAARYRSQFRAVLNTALAPPFLVHDLPQIILGHASYSIADRPSFVPHFPAVSYVDDEVSSGDSE